MGALPVSTITVQYSRESNVVYGHMQSFKITLRPEGPFNNTHLQSLLQTINQTRSISRRSINRLNYTYGVLGFLPKSVWRCSNVVLRRVCAREYDYLN